MAEVLSLPGIVEFAIGDVTPTPQQHGPTGFVVDFLDANGTAFVFREVPRLCLQCHRNGTGKAEFFAEVVEIGKSRFTFVLNGGLPAPPDKLEIFYIAISMPRSSAPLLDALRNLKLPVPG